MPRLLVGAGSLTATASLALCATVAHEHPYVRHRPSELVSSILCWLVLPLWLAKLNRAEPAAGPKADLFLSNPASSHPTPSRSLWIVAACISVASLCRTEIKLFALLVCSPGLAGQP